MNMKSEKKILTECDCGCGIIEFQRETLDEYNGEEIYISYYIDGFHANQNPGWNFFKDRVKLIWCVLTGKYYSFFDVVLTGKEAEKFKEEMKNFIE